MYRRNDNIRVKYGSNNNNNDDFNKKDLELFLKNSDKIEKQANKVKMSLIEPYEHEIHDIYEIIFNFIKTNKRKIYGGIALDYLLKNKDPNIGIYNIDDMPDIDFYSPEPLNDIVQLCNLIHQKGYADVVGREAIHKETYNIRVKELSFCDISYIPRNIYNKMPFREIDGIFVTGPEFMLIDYYRILTDIILTNFRLEKTVKRLYLLQKYFPLPHIKNPIILPNDLVPKNIELTDKNNYNNALAMIQKFITNNKEIVVVGFYAYNHFLHASELLKNKNEFKYINIPYYEIILTEYIKTALELIDKLKNNFNPDDIHVTEYYPFFQFWGHSVSIYYKSMLIAKLYNNNKKCIPYRVVSAINFKSPKINDNNNDNVYISSYSYLSLFLLIASMKHRIDSAQIMKNKTDNSPEMKNNIDNAIAMKNLYYTMLSHIKDFRRNYFDITHKTLLDDTIFQEYVTQCLGKPITPQYEKQLLIESRKRQNKRYKFNYDPSEKIIEECNYIFANSSGNAIRNVGNLKIQKNDNNIDNKEINILLEDLDVDVDDQN